MISTRRYRHLLVLAGVTAVAVAACGGAGSESRAQAPAAQAFKGAPLAMLARFGMGSGTSKSSVYVVLRTTKPLPLFRNGNVNASIAVNGERSLDATSQIGRLSRHCYQSGVLESSTTRDGEQVQVALKAPHGVNLTKTVTVRMKSRERINRIGCGGPKR